MAGAGAGDRDPGADRRAAAAGAIAAAAPFLVAWLLSPYVAFRVSRPRPVAEPPLTDAERRALRRIARKTWLFFETFVSDADHWLPPDNFQEVPDGRIAHRTSPTNRGCCCSRPSPPTTWATSACARLVERLEKTFDTLDGLEKHWGHFYNWYETQTLQPLPPRVRLDGRQRQPPGLPDHPGARPEGEDRRRRLSGPAVIQGWPTRSAWPPSRDRPRRPHRLAAMIDAPPADLAALGRLAGGVRCGGARAWRGRAAKQADRPASRPSQSDRADGG